MASVRQQDGRDETRIEKLDRNWNDLLQELRVTQTGVQLLTGLLLTLPFQQRFGELTQSQRVIYLVTVALSVTATALLIAPVSLHRALFRQRARAALVTSAHALAMVGLVMLGLAVTGVASLIFGAVLGDVAGDVAAGCAFALLAALWGAGPWVLRLRANRDTEGS
jgi:hypothetical protein